MEIHTTMNEKILMNFIILFYTTIRLQVWPPIEQQAHMEKVPLKPQ